MDLLDQEIIHHLKETLKSNKRTILFLLDLL